MVLFKIYSFSKVPGRFCGPYSEMMVNCFACGKDIGVSTERRSFSGERPSESKVRVLHAWRSMHGTRGVVLRASTFESYKRIDDLDAMLRNNIRTVLTSTDCSFSDRRNESHPAIIVGSHSTPVTVRPYDKIIFVIVMHCLMHIFLDYM